MAQVRTGLDRWMAEGPAVCGLAPRARIGLLAHAASIDRRARHALEWLREAAPYRLERLFAPEHGLWGQAQDMEPVADARDPLTGVPVVSLYGADSASLRPTQDSLADLDAVVVDLQDVGSRYYTFAYTLSHLMEAAAQRGVPVVVLDRPNPIGGEATEGPVLDPALASFVGRYPLPVRHGLTLAELARWFHRRFEVGTELRTVAMQGWRRQMHFEDTSLPWVPPSPNMPAPSTARVYPGGCLVEGTNLSEGRGTTLPFEQIGAPWLDAQRLAERLRRAAPAGALFRAASFRPVFHKHAERPCHGVHVIVEHRESFRPFASYLALLQEARAQDVDRFAWRSETYEFESERPAIDYLLGREELRGMLEDGASVAELEASWLAGLEEFRELRREVLIYD